MGPSKQLKQILQIEQNIVTNPKRFRGFQLGATEKQIQVVVGTGLEPETAETLSTPEAKVPVNAQLQIQV